MLSAATVEVDDLFLGTTTHGKRGRGTAKTPLIAGVDRAPAGQGSCVLRVVEDCTGGSYRQFGHDHLCHASKIRTDAFAGSAAGLASFGGLVQRVSDKDDPDASLPMVHKVISNFKAWVQGTFHGLAAARLQSYADEFSWRYSHRSCGDLAAALMDDVCLGYTPLRDIPATATVQPKMVE